MVIREAVRFGDGYLYTEEEGLSETEEEYGEQTEQAELQAMEQVLDESQSSQPDEIQTDQPEENFNPAKHIPRSGPAADFMPHGRTSTRKQGAICMVHRKRSLTQRRPMKS